MQQRAVTRKKTRKKPRLTSSVIELAPPHKWPVMDAKRVLNAAAILDRAVDEDLDSIIEMAEERRRRWLNLMRESIESGDDNALRFYASKLCGLPV